MKRPPLSTLLAFACVCVLTLNLTLTPATAAPLAADSTITAATVYPDRAVVTRTAVIDLPAGATELTFATLPVALADASLQVAGHGAAATILDVSATVIHAETTADPRLKILQDELAALDREKRALADQLLLNEQQRVLVSKIETAVTQPAKSPAVVSQPSPSADPFADWQRLLTFSASNTTRLAEERRALDLSNETLATKISAAEARLAALNRTLPGHRDTKTVILRLTAPAAGKLTVTLAYALPGANWLPAYDARLRSADRAVELSCFGIVRNATGEDWHNIALSLSTARPSLGAGAPTLDPWTLNLPYDRERSSGSFLLGSTKPKRPDPRSTVIGASGLSTSDISGGVSESETPPLSYETQVALAALANSPTSATFKITTPATLASDNVPQKVGITTARLPATLHYEAAPKVNETAYLNASLVNTTDFPFLPGDTATFLDDTFVTTNALKTAMPGEKFTIAFGADAGLSIKRRLLSRLGEDLGLTSKTRRITHEYKTTITNHKRTPERLLLRDVLPVSQDEKLVIKLLAPSEKEVGTVEKPGREVTREEQGRLLWTLDLKPGETRDLPFKFTIEHPADSTPSGLDL